MLDDLATIHETDTLGLLNDLTKLPNSYEGPDGVQPEPYGLFAYGEASSLPAVYRGWVDAPLVVNGTQFLFAGGFDSGDAVTLKLNAEMAGANVVLLGHDVHEPNLHVAPHPLSFYTYSSYLAYATGHKEDLQQANATMAQLAGQLKAEVEANQNPAKTLAWSLWNRVPLVLTSKRNAGLASAVQRMFARVGKAFAVTVGEHPLETVTGMLEGRHGFGDDIVVLALGDEDADMALAKEVLSSRVAQIEAISLPFGNVTSAPTNGGAQALVLWYISAWVAAYLALLNQLDPGVNGIYDAARTAHLQK